MTDLSVLSPHDILIIISCLFTGILLFFLFQYLKPKISFDPLWYFRNGFPAQFNSKGYQVPFTRHEVLSGPNQSTSKRSFLLHLEAAIKIAAECITKGTLKECPDFLKGLDKSLLQYLTRRPSKVNLEFAFQYFIQPMMKFIIEHKYYELPIGLELVSHLHEATVAYNDILTQTSYDKKLAGRLTA